MENFSRCAPNSISIIVPCKKINADVERCIKKCRIAMDTTDELIVVTDDDCPGLPATKRNWAMRRARSEAFAFLDSDAYPPQLWLAKARIFLSSHPAVCGPGVIPPDAPFLEKAADWAFCHLPYSERVRCRPRRVLPEYPTFNLIVWRDYATEFEPYLTGEDSLFCRKIKEGIYYDPCILVYHRRRPLFKPFWKQVGTWGQHRGYLVMLGFLGLVSGVFVYSVNFVKGLFRRPK